LPNMVYAFGGRNQSRGPLDIAEMLNTWRGQWVRLPPMPVRRAGAGASLLPDGRMMVTGGYNELGIAEGLLATCDIFDPVRVQWAEADSVAPLSRARWGHGCATLRQQVYAIGGCSVQMHAAPSEAFMETMRDCEVYDSTANRWSLCSPLQIARSGARAVALQGDRYLVVVGGCDDVFGRAETQPTVELFDADSGAWSLLAPRLLFSRTTAAVVATGDRELFVVGGAPSLASVELYQVGLPSPGSPAEEGDEAAEPHDDHVAAAAPSTFADANAIVDLVEGRMGCQAAVVDLPAVGQSFPVTTRRSVVVVGGERCDDEPGDDYPRIKQFRAVPVLDVKTRQWRSDSVVPALPIPRTAVALCVGVGHALQRSTHPMPMPLRETIDRPVTM